MRISYEVREENTTDMVAGELIGWYSVDESEAQRFAGDLFKLEDGTCYPWGAVSIPNTKDGIIMCIVVPTQEGKERLGYDKNYTPIRTE